ncbi:hypothetical protein DFH11DRAFT_1639294 [Phellopilus nigrolimitatus]|nr:hypothetical protein DFH11DRAFT_1639294 [Phellopilus nigrolimitatus]
MATESDLTPIPHDARKYHNYPDSHYVLPTDEQEVERLRLQHNVVKNAFEGRLIFPPLKSQSSYFVLDSGVGPAAWLLDVASELSVSAILHGVDLESRLFPHSRPTNVSFSVGSIVSLPEEWKNKFDLVNQRLLLTALTRSQWPQTLGQIHRVLSPGGWVQLGEVGTWHAGPVSERHRRMLHALFDSRELLLDVSMEIPELLRKAKFDNIKVEVRNLPLAGETGADARNNWIGAFRAVKTPIMRLGGLGFVQTEEEFDHFLDELEKEWDSTPDAEIEFHIFYAQKPTDTSDSL